MFPIFKQFPEFLELGSWTSRHIRPLFDLFRDENVAPALALIIFSSALALLWQIYWIDRRNRIPESGFQ
jgi:hypothetical protein